MHIKCLELLISYSRTLHMQNRNKRIPLTGPNLVKYSPHAHSQLRKCQYLALSNLAINTSGF